MRDVLLGFLTYLLSISALIAVIVLCHYLFAPPLADRARSFAFVGGGGMLMFAFVAMLGASFIIFASTH